MVTWRLPVEVLSGVTHAVDAIIGGEVLLDGLLQCKMVLLCHCRAATQGTADQPHSSLTVHLNPSDACNCPTCHQHTDWRQRFWLGFSQLCKHAALPYVHSLNGLRLVCGGESKQFLTLSGQQIHVYRQNHKAPGNVETMNRLHIKQTLGDITNMVG